MASEGESTIRAIMACVDAGDVAGAVAFLADDFAGHYASTSEPLDRDGMRLMFSVFTTAFPDGTHQFEDFVASDDRVAFRAIWRGRQTGEFNGMPPTGNAVEIVEMGIGRVDDAKLAEMWMMPDQAAMMQQLSVVPA